MGNVQTIIINISLIQSKWIYDDIKLIVFKKLLEF